MDIQACVLPITEKKEKPKKTDSTISKAHVKVTLGTEEDSKKPVESGLYLTNCECFIDAF